MRTGLDSNIVSAVWSDEPSRASIIAKLGEARQEGALVISPVVYSELMAHPMASETFLVNFLEVTQIQVNFSMDKEVWVEAGRRFARYAERRRQGTGGEGPRRLLADFVVGAHALLHADRLMTLDRRFYVQDFPELRLYS